MAYYIYGKAETMKRYMPICGGDFVRSRLRAEMFTDKERADKVCASIQSGNPEMQFQVRCY